MNNLKNLRLEKNINQTKIAKLLGVSLKTYNWYENEVAIMSADSLIKLSEFFEVSVDYILGLTESKTSTVFQNEFNNLDPEDQDSILKIIKKLNQKK